MESIITVLKERGFIDALTNEKIGEICQKPITFYIGFDPTADSLHLGNLLGIMAAAWFQRYGHTPVIVLGGATGRVGDPSGKSIERPLLDTETITHNIEKIRIHFEQILDVSGKYPSPVIINNDEWYKDMRVIEFLRDVGKHFRVGPMLGKESVRARLESEEGISFTEFSYQIIQGYDFYHLFSEHNVLLQLGGSDQWGNIVAGTDLIRKLTGKSAFGLTWPLLTRSDGKKFGKTAEGAVWLSAKKLSPYQFYQYLFQIPEALEHAAIANQVKLNILSFESDKIVEDGDVAKAIGGCDGYLVPGGFGERGWIGKILATKYCRENQIPYFGLCLGMQALCVDFARHVLDLQDANSTEMDPMTPHPIVSLLSEQRDVKNLGGTMRLGAYNCSLKKGSLAHKAYQADLISERHRHRYEFNNAYKEQFEEKGLLLTGVLENEKLCEIAEITDHPWMLAVQYHPEFKSKPTAAHPLFRDFIAACAK